MVGDMTSPQAHFHPCNTALPFSAFSALSLLRNYNQLLIPSDASPRYQHLISSQSCPVDDCKMTSSSSESELSPPHSGGLALGQSGHFVPTPLFGYQPVTPLFRPRENALSPVFGRTLVSSMSPRRQRGEKKPIPEEQKDDKYFERRRRNNQAAKKSRDARKMREDQIALRATMLEHENAILRAQIITLREEASSLRQLLMAKKVEQSNSER